MEKLMKRVRPSKGEVICVNGLGFRSKEESNTWLKANSPLDKFRFIVDFYVRMEHIHQQLTGSDAYLVWAGSIN